MQPLPVGSHYVCPAVSAGSLSLFRPTGGSGGPQIHVLCGLKGSGCRPSGLNGRVFHGGGVGICQVRTNTVIVVCLRWHFASHLIADVLSGLHRLHISLRTFIASSSDLKSGEKGHIMNLVNLTCEYQLGELGNIPAVVESY